MLNIKTATNKNQVTTPEESLKTLTPLRLTKQHLKDMEYSLDVIIDIEYDRMSEILESRDFDSLEESIKDYRRYGDLREKLRDHLEIMGILTETQETAKVGTM